MNFYSYSTQLAQHNSDIERHWQRSEQGYLKAPSGKLFYSYHIPKTAKYSVVLVNGRIESAWKYQELLWELAQNNIAVFTYDHIGQGLSERLTGNAQTGYVSRFTDYGDDLNAFIEKVVMPRQKGPLFILAHSMGAAISCDYLSRYSHPISGAFLSAPMFDINTHNTPYKLAKWLAKIGCWLGLGKHYAVGQSNYFPVPFEENQLTHCHIRYQRFRSLYQNEAELCLGGVSYGWLNQTFNFIEKIPNLIIQTPLFIVSAEQDEVVDNRAHARFIETHPDAQLRTIANAKHELLCETDDIRQTVLKEFYQFCDNLGLTTKETGS
ncbi:alpha/beta fold hydrolase [Pseudoalteromonas sp. JBTF-M23]|uniref:Alpha/beta fold hydrolase n=1 Tax=Pseudoalteromonas caenipelagi TaxID=2726988 RepID=A0A849VGH9_9GAMM|nr:alpha/beta fold hydrolase [Pseudoalteromonas caenipelagi]NOU51613.1 alpha/beta fold hydrolase [Pseudoalteromonas caenipelagi]